MQKRVKLEYTGLVILILIIGGIFFFVNDLDFEITGNAFLNTSTYTSANISSFPTGNFSNVSVFGDGSVKLSFNPIIVSTLVDTGAGSNGWLNYVQGISLQGDYAYVVAQNNNSISVINISDKFNPTIVGSATDNTWIATPQKVEVVGNYAYLTSYDSSSVAVINVTDKIAPSRLVSLVDGIWLVSVRD